MEYEYLRLRREKHYSPVPVDIDGRIVTELDVSITIITMCKGSVCLSVSVIMRPHNMHRYPRSQALPLAPLYFYTHDFV